MKVVHQEKQGETVEIELSFTHEEFLSMMSGMEKLPVAMQVVERNIIFTFKDNSTISMSVEEWASRVSNLIAQSDTQGELKVENIAIAA